ncbi:MAG TPA: SURF1 family protein, partial [Acidimicrobiales bacterium]|nr:SURF1 family protein [Acidimicrobiales bacterium]
MTSEHWTTSSRWSKSDASGVRVDGGRSLTGVSRYAFALKPKWIFGHLLVLVLIIGFINAGLWQVRRLHERQAFNEQVVANMEAPIASVDGVLPPGSDRSDVGDVLNRRITASGHYLIDDEVVINAQASPDGVPGVWIVTPLQLDDGRVLLVNRGWLPSTGPMTEPPADARPPSGEVTVSGLVSQSQAAAEGESAETDKARQGSFLRIDVARIQRQFSETLVPAFLLRRAQTPPDAGTQKPQNLAPPELSNGPHLSYTLQWFGFTLVALIGYPMLLWMIGRDREKEGPNRDDAAADDLPPGAFVDADGILDLTGVTRFDPDTDMEHESGDPLRR